MVSVEKFVQRKAVLCLAVSLFVMFLFACGNHNLEAPLYSRVTFFNESSYHVTIYHTSFSGPVLVEKLAPGNSFFAELSPSNNYGVGSVFSIEYWYPVRNDLVESENIWVGSIDPNRQIAQNLEGGESYVIQIPQPNLNSLELQESFVKILNLSEMPLELECLSMSLKQEGSGEVHVPSGKTGVYKVYKNSACVKDGETRYYSEIKGYTIKQGLTIEPCTIPEFDAYNGYIYNFEFNGNTVELKGEQEIFPRNKL